MEKMFTRTLLGAAVAMAAVAGNANAAIELHGQAVQVYGQAAGSYQIWSPEANGAETTAVVDMESRMGFRGTVEFDNFGPDFVWQIETGNANNRDGAYGQRDTFVGLSFDGVGTVKFGRQLVAAYNYVDWPHTNPGLGNVFDWHNDIDAKYEDRADNVLRFDSANFGGFNFQATLSGMDKTTDAAAVSVAASYSADMFSVHAGHYTRGGWETKTEDSFEFDTETGLAKPVKGEVTKHGDVDYTIVGGSLFLGKATLTAGYKMMNNDVNDNSQNAYSVTAAYWLNDQWLVKAGYAATDESDNAKADDSDTAITGRILYALPSNVWYLDVRNYDMDGSAEKDDGTRIMLGTEFYF
uniref:porin n=1 Tax=Thaumasiovibrio occultus TaxID=1891184 RepID=UPI000B36215A|nr:porin [Thaumasiovibrio occultus]